MPDAPFSPAYAPVKGRSRVYYAVASEPEDRPFAEVRQLSHAHQGQKFLYRTRVLDDAHDPFQGLGLLLERGVTAERDPRRFVPARLDLCGPLDQRLEILAPDLPAVYGGEHRNADEEGLHERGERRGLGRDLSLEFDERRG